VAGADTPGSFLPDSRERVVLARKDPSSMVGLQWTGAEPEGMFDTDDAVLLGAEWEGDELVCYNMDALRHAFLHAPDGYLEDSD